MGVAEQRTPAPDVRAETPNSPDPSELEAVLRSHQEAAAQRYAQLHHDARAVDRAMEGWARVQSEDA